MTVDAGTNPPGPLILVAHAEGVFLRSLESVLTHGGYRVVQADTAEQALALAGRHSPDAIILDTGLTQPAGYELCRLLRAEPAVSLVTPILLTSAGPVTRGDQIEALRAGAWEVRGDPLDTEELLLRLAVYLRGKLEADRVRGAGMVDGVSGLYNAAGTARRSEELASLTARQGLPLACVVFQPANGGRLAPDELARAFKTHGRVSDVVGRTGAAEFTIFAPATDEPAAGRLVQRLAQAVARQTNQPTTALRAGYSAAPAIPPVSPGELLARARTALGA